MRFTANERGYTLTELLVSSGIMLTVTAAIFGLMNPAQGTSQAQPEVADMQQRMRVASDTIFKELVMVGAGPYMGAQTGSLARFFAPVLPRKAAGSTPDARTVFRPDAITITYIPNTSSQTTIRDEMPPSGVPIKVNPQAGCPDTHHNALCGFREGMEIMLFDDTGASDTFTITSVADEALQLRHRGMALSKTYAIGSKVAEAVRKTFYFDTATNQLRVIIGETDTPLADNVVDLQFSYFGDPNPPVEPIPPAGSANCLYDSTGNYTAAMPVLTANAGSLAALPASLLTDGPWCGGGTNEFDADLLRIRQIRVSIRVQAGSPSLRGSDAGLFRNPGTAQGGERFVPDYAMTFDVTPRNLNLSR